MIDYAKVLMGNRAVHVPFNYVRQGNAKHGLILGQETGNALAFGATKTHVLVKGDLIFRPHLIIESDLLIGMGAAAIITSDMFANEREWRKRRSENNVLLDSKI